MTVSELSHRLRERLQPLDEAEALRRIIFEDVLLMRPVDVVVNPDRELPPFIPAKVERIVDRLLAGEPVQYILGHARFCGLDLKVTPAVLIPRPETQQLVDMIVDRYGRRKDLRVIDLGTGSGAIAIALARALPFSRVIAIDISPAALDVARQNASALGVNIEFKCADMLTFRPDERFDIVVSNPPYVMVSERGAMERNVLDHEPEGALFVPDNDPMRFYSAILANFKGRAGAIYFEINPLCADRYPGAEIVKDAFGRKRFAIYDPA